MILFSSNMVTVSLIDFMPHNGQKDPTMQSGQKGCKFLDCSIIDYWVETFRNVPNFCMGKSCIFFMWPPNEWDHSRA